MYYVKGASSHIARWPLPRHIQIRKYRQRWLKACGDVNQLWGGREGKDTLSQVRGD